MARTLKRKQNSPAAAVGATPKVTSIRGRIMRQVLPVALVPLILLGILAVAGIFLIQQRTTDAVASAEKILTEQVVEDTVTRSSERVQRELAEYVDQWVFRVDRLNSQAEFREAVVQVSNDTQAENFAAMTPGQLEIAVDSATTTRTNVLARTEDDDLTTFETTGVQILLVSEEGFRIGSTNRDTDAPLNDYSSAEWFTRTRAEGSFDRSFVDDGESEPAFEIVRWIEPPATTRGGAVLRVRVPLSNVQSLLDQVSGDDAVDAALVDTSASVLIADTVTNHNPDFLFDQSTLMTAPSGLNVELLRPGTIQNDTTVSSARQVAEAMRNDSDVRFQWLVQTSQPLDVAAGSLTEVRQVADDVSGLRRLLTISVIALVLAALVLTFLTVRRVANQITRPMKIMSDQAQAAAEEGIPSVVEAARTSEELPDLPDFDIETNDELAILAHSMNTMQDAAVDLAAGQAKMRRQNVARTFVSLGRRNQNLLNRQLEFIDELEQKESDADALENLFRLDHLATRMRRNAENLLVLAGEQTPRRWGKPIAVRDVLRAAASEIADYRRVRLGEIDVATVSGNLATDLSHLIAELLENAGSFSPPTTPIEVLGQHTSTHYRLAIVDQGIGMDAQALAQVNDRLKNPVDFADAPSAYLGLFVVGRLAQELGITVRLASADPTGEGRRRGTIAFIDLPVALLSSDAATPIEINDRGSEGIAHRTEALDAAQTTPQAVAAPAVVVPSSAAPPQTGAPDRTPLPAPASRQVAEEVTNAGFPKRSRGATSVSTTPQLMNPREDQTAQAAPTTDAAPVAAPPATEITAAGFPKRSSSSTGASAPTPAPMPEPVANAAPKRDAAEVSNSLRSIRAAVARGRAGAEAQGPEASDPADNSLSPPPLPITPVPPVPPIPSVVPTPEAGASTIEAAPQEVSHQPTQPGSES